jgi:hypothetical protein
MAEFVRSFDEHLEYVSKMRSKQLQAAQNKALLFLLIPILVPFLMIQVFISAGVSPTTAIPILIVSLIALLYISDKIQKRAEDYLRGKKVLVLTFRYGRGKCFTDWAVIKSVSLIGTKHAAEIFPVEMENPDKEIREYEIEFEEFPYFQKVILRSPCPFEDLLEFTPQLVLWKSYICKASASVVTFTRIGHMLMGKHGYIPIVYPTDSDYEAEKLQALTGAYKVTEKGTVTVPIRYDHWKYLEILGEKESLERELIAKEMELRDREGREMKVAKDLLEDWIESGVPYTRGAMSGLLEWLKKHKVAITILVVVVAVFIFFLYGGYLLHR